MNFEEEVNLTLRNYPASGVEGAVADVTFGPASEDFRVLITMAGASGDIDVVVGNGPPTEQLPDILPNILRELADIIEDLEF